MATRNAEKSILRNELERLEQLRDELRLQAHLLKADMKKELEDLEKKFQKLKRDANANQVKRATEKSVEEISDATRLLLDTVRDGLTRVRKSLKSK